MTIEARDGVRGAIYRRTRGAHAGQYFKRGPDDAAAQLERKGARRLGREEWLHRELVGGAIPYYRHDRWHTDEGERRDTKTLTALPADTKLREVQAAPAYRKRGEATPVDVLFDQAEDFDAWGGWADVDDFEAKAEEFFDATGIIAPGKSVPAELAQPSTEARLRAWDEFWSDVDELHTIVYLDASTLEGEPGDPVTVWEDQSGNENHAHFEGDGEPPFIRGHSGIHYDRLIGELHEPGRYEDMPSDDYHASGAISSSGFGPISRSIDHYLTYRADDGRTKTFDEGNAIHAWLLEGPEAFDRMCVRRPATDEGNFRKKVGKAWRGEQLAKGLVILDADQFTRINSAIEAVQNHPYCANILEHGESEVSYFWEETVDGVPIPCRVRPDWITETSMGPVGVDLKTSRDASEDEFAKAAARYRYGGQAAFYRRGFEAVTGEPLVAWVVIVVEKVAPFGVAIYRLDDVWLDRGREIYTEALARVAEWLTSDTPETVAGYPQHIQTLTMPRWA